MDYMDIMSEAARIYHERGAKYGDTKRSLDNIAAIATLLVGVHLSAHDIALILHALKLDRMTKDRANPEHYVDGINYYAFAGEVIMNQNDAYSSEPQMSDSDISDIASKFSPPSNE